MSGEASLPPMSAAATARWKRAQLKPLTRDFNSAKYRRVKNLVSTHNSALFLNITNQQDDSQKVTKQEDLKEVCSQLVFIKEKHDASKANNLSKEKKLKIHENTMSQISKMEARTGNKMKGLEDKTGAKQRALDAYHREIDDESCTCKVYEHMIERMKQEKIELDRKTNELNAQIRGKTLVLNEELEKKRRQREDTIHTKEALLALTDFIRREKQGNKEKVDGINRDVLKKLENTERRQDRIKRLSEIAEETENEEKTQSVVQTKERLLLLKLLYNLVQKKQETLVKWHSRDQDAYLRAKTISEFENIEGLVQKFLTKEQEYSDLIGSIIDAKGKVDLHIQKNEELENKLQQLELVKKDTSNTLKEKVSRLLRRIAAEKNKQTRLVTTHSNIGNWVSKVVTRFNMFLRTPMELPQSANLPDTI